MRFSTHTLGALAGLLAAAALAPAALASTTPSVTLNQSRGNQAGVAQNLGMDLRFANNPATDSPDRLTINLPPGLLADATVDNGRCLTTTASASPPAACQIGSGTVTAAPTATTGLALGVLPSAGTVQQQVSFYLVRPPAPGDLGGLEVVGSGVGELGSPGDILIRPTGDPLGVGATIKLTVPDTLTIPGVGANAPISVSEINSTFDNLRYPTTCPAAAAQVTGSATSYSDATARSFSAALPVTGCSSLAYSPTFSATARRDAADNKVALTTTITQAAKESPNRNVALRFPTATFGANLNALENFCAGTLAGCPTVGSVTARSPLYPAALTGKAYLTGDSSGLKLTLAFPSPFQLTLVGAIDLRTNTASFTGLPDIPLTNLDVSLAGGPAGLFFTSCQTPSGSATATLTDQNGDPKKIVNAPFTVAGCSAAGTGGGGSAGSGAGASSSPTAGAHVVAGRLSGLATGRPRLSFRVAVGRRASKLTRLTVKLPQGLVLVRHRVHGRQRVQGVTLRSARAKSLAVAHGHLVITLRRSARAVTVTLGPRALREGPKLRAQAAGRTITKVKLAVVTRNAKRKQKTLHLTVKL